MTIPEGMALEEAIERLTPLAEGGKVTTELEDLDALQLGIEALRLNLYMRETYPFPQLLKLPGETK